MKNLLEKNKKILIILLILIIIAGIIVISIVGFKKSPEYMAGTKIEVYIPKGYEKQDILDIANESFGGKEITIYDVEKLGQVACIKVKEYTQEELDTYKTKISEKYLINTEKLEVHEILVPATKISSLVKPYMTPTIIVTALALVYLLIRNIKANDLFKVVFNIIFALVMVEGLYFSLIAIIRIPFGILTMPFALALFIITLLIQANCVKSNAI